MRLNLPSFLFWGCEDVDSAIEKRKIVNTNAAVPIALVSMTFYGLIYIATGNPALIKSLYCEIPFFVVFSTVPMLNKNGHISLSRWLFCFSLTGSVFAVILFAQGGFLGLHQYFLLFALVPLMFFPLSRWGAVLFFFTLNISLFMFSEYVGITPEVAIGELPPWLVTAMRVSFQTTSFLTLLFIVWFSDQSAETNETKLELLSRTDGLTGIPNRRFFDEVLVNEWQRAARTRQSLALAMVDVDWFKKYNDHYGHQAGDDCLRSVAQALRNTLRRSSDLVARYGGEEFVFVIVDADINQAEKIANDACEAVRNLELSHGLSDFLYVTVSIGIASVVPIRGEEPDALLKRADAALYRAKQEGRNKVVSEHRMLGT